MTFKIIGADENNHFPQRVEDRLQNDFYSEGQGNGLEQRVTTLETGLTDLESNVPSLAFNRKKNAVFFGDSWLTVYSNALATRIANLLNLNAKSYAQSNAAFTSGTLTIEQQVATATADNTVDKGLIETVIVIAGTNNTFFGREFTFASVRDVFSSIIALYPNAAVYFIPNNANDYNSGRTYQYNTMTLGAEYAGASCATIWSVWLNWYNYGGFYAGSDDNGRQHLSTDGTNQFASWVASWIRGNDLSGKAIDVRFAPVIDETNTSLQFSSGHSMADSYNDRSFIQNGICTMDIELTNLQFKSGQTVPSLRLTGSLEPCAPISINANGTNATGYGYAGSAYSVHTNIVPNATTGYTLFTVWAGSGVFTSVRLHTEFAVLGAQP